MARPLCDVQNMVAIQILGLHEHREEGEDELKFTLSVDLDDLCVDSNRIIKSKSRRL